MRRAASYRITQGLRGWELKGLAAELDSVLSVARMMLYSTFAMLSANMQRFGKD
jgi:hypothetical protein